MTDLVPVPALRRLATIGESAALAALAAAPPDGAAVVHADSLGSAATLFASDDPVDLVLVDAGELKSGVRPELVSLTAQAAVVVVADAGLAAGTAADPAADAAVDSDAAIDWIAGGADDVLTPAELATPSGLARLRFAVVRRGRLSHDPAWATDLATGLPHRRQLVEHLSQLLALRERDPSEMAVVALRIERHGVGDAELLRRKIAVRLRASVRAGDVVASVDSDVYCVLLGSLQGGSHAAAVAAKLAALIAAPYPVGAASVRVAVATGVSVFPADGNQADRLIRRALALAAAAPALGAGSTGVVDRGVDGAAREAANDA